MMHAIEQLEHSLGYTFKSKDLLVEALTHCSAGMPHNQRLEFLGDALLNMIIAEALFDRYQHVSEGVLSHMRATLVCGNTLAELAQRFELGNYLQLGPGELKSGGFRRASILADAIEAVIAAIYLDSDFQALKIILLGWYESLLAEISPKIEKDPKTRLQEYLQAKRIALPDYSIIEQNDDPNASYFKVACAVSSLDLTVQGVGTSRRQAEQAAAKQLLQQLEQA